MTQGRMLDFSNLPFKKNLNVLMLKSYVEKVELFVDGETRVWQGLEG